MKSAEVRKKYLEFFKKRGHAVIPSAPLLPENDPTTLFTSSGMQPLIPYLLGQPHPSGKRLVDSQKSFRSQDIEEVGDNRHTTFFEMLGNWSLGDYFKKEQLPWIFEFLTRELGLDPKRLYVTVFEGNASVPKDTESIDIWKDIFSGVGIVAKENERIFAYPARKNWWSRSGEPDTMPPGEPGGPDSEVFFDFGTPHYPQFGETCHPNCDCGRFMEIANSVFMQYQKMPDGTLKELKQKNVDFGGGLERLVAATEGKQDVFETDLFSEIIQSIQLASGLAYVNDEHKKTLRIIADHVKAAVFLIADGIEPSNKMQGYVLRRLLRRAAVKLKLMSKSSTEHQFAPIVQSVLRTYKETDYFNNTKEESIKNSVALEMFKFTKSLDQGLREIQKITSIDGKIAFDLYQTYGFPLEITEEIFREKGQRIDHQQFASEFEKHQDLSRSAAKGMFKGGLADKSEQTVKLHTAHHLLLAALQKIVDQDIKQRGSNITAERLRMDFNYAKKLMPEDVQKIEKLVNEKIFEDIPVVRQEMEREAAEKIGAQMEFGHKYPDRVSVYFIGPEKNFFSAEFCGGPHVAHTGLLGRFQIIKEESAGSGVRRIYAVLS
ncbi:alanine--tRNA ligase [Candidatus Gottesmanbacteria bacterium]|nr:alanine--tRNA ligase [Candidatus Gottesmanbacteria bacterium]